MAKSVTLKSINKNKINESNEASIYYTKCLMKTFQSAKKEEINENGQCFIYFHFLNLKHLSLKE